jgi:hypothetical protein
LPASSSRLIENVRRRIYWIWNDGSVISITRSGAGREPGVRDYSPRNIAVVHEDGAARLLMLHENSEESGRRFDALFAMRQAETVVRALEFAGYEIRKRR